MIANLKSHWAQLQARERYMLLGGALALVVLGGYALVWDPYMQGVARLEQEVASQRELLAWMERSAAEVKALRGNRGAVRAGGQSLLSLADSTAKAQGLGNALKRVQPDGTTSVRVWLEQAAFDDVMRWLDRLTAESGVRVTGLVVERRPEPGRVDVRLVLEGAA